MFAVRVTGQIANLRAGGTGTTNVLLSPGTSEERLVTFSARPTYLDKLPPEVEAYPHVVVTEIPAKDWKRLQAGGAKATDLELLPLRAVPAPAPREASAEGPNSYTAEDLAQFDGIKGFGPATRGKLLEAGISRGALESGNVTTAELRAVLDALQPAQQEAVLDATTPEIRAQLKAERIQ